MSDNYYHKAINYIRQRFKFRKITSPQKKFIGICMKLEVKYQRQFYLLGKYYDFYLPSYKVLVQVDGNYWHGKGLRTQQKNLMQRKNAANDIFKDQLARIRGIPLYRVWEDQITQQFLQRIIKEKENDKKI